MIPVFDEYQDNLSEEAIEKLKELYNQYQNTGGDYE